MQVGLSDCVRQVRPNQILGLEELETGGDPSCIERMIGISHGVEQEGEVTLTEVSDVPNVYLSEVGTWRGIPKRMSVAQWEELLGIGIPSRELMHGETVREGWRTTVPAQCTYAHLYTVHGGASQVLIRFFVSPGTLEGQEGSAPAYSCPNACPEALSM